MTTENIKLDEGGISRHWRCVGKETPCLLHTGFTAQHLLKQTDPIPAVFYHNVQ